MKKQSKTKQSPAGIYTPEAAVVISMLFFLTAALVFLGFYLHDRLVLYGTAAKCLQEEARYLGKAAETDGSLSEAGLFDGGLQLYGRELTPEKEAEFREHFLMRASSRLLMSEVESAELKKDGHELRLRYRAVFTVKTGSVVKRLLYGNGEIESEVSLRLPLRPEEVVRIVRGIKRFGEKTE